MQAHPLRLLDLTAEPVARTRIIQDAGTLRWMKPGLFGRQYELRSSDRCLATLSIRGLFRPEATGEAGRESWIMEPLEPGKIVVRARPSYHEAAVFDMSLSDHAGILRFEDGRTIMLSSNFWKGSAEFQTLSGEPLIRYRFHGVLRPSADTEILSEGRRMPELSWLLMLGWFLVVGYL
jgi:hypothetical protein